MLTGLFIIHIRVQYISSSSQFIPEQRFVSDNSMDKYSIRSVCIGNSSAHMIPYYL